MNSEHHYLHPVLKSDSINDCIVSLNAYETAQDFVYGWVDDYYADYGFDYGLVSFEINEFGDDGSNVQYFEVEIKRDGKPYETLSIMVQLQRNRRWQVVRF